MSAGAFTRTRYEADYTTGQIHPIRVQPETLTANIVGATSTTNAAPTATGTSPISAQVSRSTRALGLHARLVSLKVNGTPPTGYAPNSSVRLPALNIAFFEACQAAGAQVNYLEAVWDVIGTRQEQVR